MKKRNGSYNIIGGYTGTSIRIQSVVSQNKGAPYRTQNSITLPRKVALNFGKPPTLNPIYPYIALI